MTRSHASLYTKPLDPYAAYRCDCRHIVYTDMAPGGRCRWNYTGQCPCADHRTPADRAEQEAGTV